ncbi:MAG: hypothetical protein IT208_11385 [Chthonomonadales bacterium]|nr:hypothetical protein [Chthonomonadales bacterium]
MNSEPYLYAGAWGYRSDGDAGLMLVGARYYDAHAGRFVTRDTLLGEHPYLYCEHEPVGGVDPSGHDALDDLSSFFAGWGDTLTGGATGVARAGLIALMGGEGDGANHESGAYLGGEIVGSAHLVALSGYAVLRPGTGALQQVTHWGGESPWVMTGGRTIRNWLFAGAPAAYEYAETFVVPGSSLAWPSGWEWFKGLMGQRIMIR